MKLSPNDHIYFMGIAGTGMASVAALAKEAGYFVTGSDSEIYPPMSTMLEQLKIPVAKPYQAENLEAAKPKLVVVANVLSKNNVEIEALNKTDIPYTSFPKFLGDFFLENRCSIVVSGTHGKTTTTSLLAYILTELGENPGFLIGGIPKNFSFSSRLGKGSTFVIEGDEYDTAYFDKGPKFLHYRPKHLIINNIEFDHADIYANLDAIKSQFIKLAESVPKTKNICANIDDPGVLDILKRMGLEKKVTTVACKGEAKDADVRVVTFAAKQNGDWSVVIQSNQLGLLELTTQLHGAHNMANLAQAIAVLGNLVENSTIKPVNTDRLKEVVAGFEGVKRRLELLHQKNGISIFEDFAHHPTAVTEVIKAFRASRTDDRLIIAFEPKNASNRRNIFTDALATAFKLADRVLIGKCPIDLRIPEAERMDTELLRAKVGEKALAFTENEQLYSLLIQELKPGDAVIFMSSGSFSGIQHRLARDLSSR